MFIKHSGSGFTATMVGIVVCVFSFGPELNAHPHSSFAQVVMTVESRPQDNPWQINSIQDKRTAIYLGNSQFLLFTPYPIAWIRSVQIKKKGLSELSATYSGHDDGLGLLVVKLDAEAMKLLKPSGLKPVKWATGFKMSMTGQRLQLISMHGLYSDRTVYSQRVGQYKASSRAARIPVLNFSGQVQKLHLGDVAVYKNNVVGLLLDFDSNDETGRLLAWPLIHRFVKELKSARNEIRFIKWNQKKSFGLMTVLPFTRLKLKELVGVTRDYYGLKKYEGAVIVTHVESGFTGRSGLRKGDLIIKVNNHRILSDGMIMDPGYGIVNVDLFLAYKQGKPRKNNKSIKLYIQRDKHRRTINYRPATLAGRNLIIPEKLEYPYYYIFAGLLLHEISGDYIKKNPGLPAFVHNIYKKNILNTPGRNKRLVVLNRIFPLEINKGYSQKHIPVSSIDGVVVQNLEHAWELLESAILRKKQIVIGLHNKQLLVFDYQLLEEANQSLQKRYQIPFISYHPDD